MSTQPAPAFRLPGCTIAAATGSATRDGRPLMMSTSDDPFNTRTRLVVEHPAGALRYIATQIISPPPMVSWTGMHTRGLNEAGLAYCWSYVTPADEPTDATAVGIPYYQFGNLVLSTATSVDEALSLLDAYPRAYHGNYLFAERSGKIALAEVGTRTLRVTEATLDGSVGRTNHWIEGASVEDAGIECSSHHRFGRISALLAQEDGGIGPDTFMSFCRDHEGRDTPGILHSICSHGHEGQGAEWFGTVSSEVIEPASGILWYCYGWPCGESPSAPVHQPGQEHSWGAYLPFRLAELDPGEYVAIDGRLTQTALRHLASRSSRILQPHA
jgi:hypothetical protein